MIAAFFAREEEMKKYRVLALDGGGIRGLVTTLLLQRIVSVPGLENFLEDIDLVAGTSSGGLIALGIAHQVNLAKLRDLFINSGPRIFDDSWLDDLVDLGKLRGADYAITPLRREIQKLFGSASLGHLKKRVLITSFDLDNEDPHRRTWKPKLFHNFSGQGNDRSTPVYKVGLYTSAAPTYFPSVDGYIDGGVYAANPSMCALAQTQDRRYRPTPSMDRITLISLGTGTSLQYIKGRSHDWGYVQWVKPLMNLMLDGTAGIADYQCRQILADRYHRLAPSFPTGRSVPMDDATNIPYLIEFAESISIRKTVNWLSRHWREN
jgi:patatin-like phospholipase/acyl hydrolase